MTRHAELSPSKFVQWDLCPCFESGPVGDAAIQGTLEHEVLEAMLRGEEPPEHDEETAEKVVWAYEYILEEANRLGVGAGEFLLDLAAPSGVSAASHGKDSADAHLLLWRGVGLTDQLCHRLGAGVGQRLQRSPSHFHMLFWVPDCG